MARTNENTDFSSVLDQWQGQQRNGYRWEGETGVENFENLVKTLGYDDLDNFLCDNPAAIEAMLEFITEHADKAPNSEWTTKLAEDCDYEEDEDEPLLKCDHCSNETTNE